MCSAPSASSSKWRKPPSYKAPGATAGDSGSHYYSQIVDFYPPLRRGRIRLSSTSSAWSTSSATTAVHRWEGLFERSLFVQIIEAAHTEGFEEQWCGAPVLSRCGPSSAVRATSFRLRKVWRVAVLSMPRISLISEMLTGCFMGDDGHHFDGLLRDGPGCPLRDRSLGSPANCGFDSSLMP